MYKAPTTCTAIILAWISLLSPHKIPQHVLCFQACSPLHELAPPARSLLSGLEQRSSTKPPRDVPRGIKLSVLCALKALSSPHTRASFRAAPWGLDCRAASGPAFAPHLLCDLGLSGPLSGARKIQSRAGLPAGASNPDALVSLLGSYSTGTCVCASCGTRG